MTLYDARSLIITALGRMNTFYSQTVFDEWVVVSLRPEGASILAYYGPRVTNFRKQFAEDVAPLRAEMAGKRLTAGDFEFAPEAAGTHFDVCMRLGATGYLIGNHTG
jgi:hypothetical protein